jgi:hypothetical protein
MKNYNLERNIMREYAKAYRQCLAVAAPYYGVWQARYNFWMLRAGQYIQLAIAARDAGNLR